MTSSETVSHVGDTYIDAPTHLRNASANEGLEVCLQIAFTACNNFPRNGRGIVVLYRINNVARAIYRAGWLSLSLFGLSACSSLVAQPTAMSIAVSQAAKPFPSVFEHAMCARKVIGGEGASRSEAPIVSDEAFRQALTTSLDAAGLNAEAGACHYPIEVNLLGLSQPIIGFDMTVTSHASYTVFNTGGQPVLTAMIDAAYTATMSDSPWGTLRNQMATEGSIRVSIQDFFDRLRVADIK